MIIEEVDKKKYSEIIPNPYYIFGSAQFNELNQNKVTKVHYLLFKDSKYRMGIIGGESNGIFKSPFSAPFGGFSFIRTDLGIEKIEESIAVLKQWASNKNITKMEITLPPFIYMDSYLSKLANALFRANFAVKNIDLNYHFPLSSFNKDYLANIWHAARKNLLQALNNQLSFLKCDDSASKKAAYEVIKINRESRGYPLKMSWEKIFCTTQIIPADFFLVKNKDNENIAAAIIFKINHDIVQVIYWGDIPDFSYLRTMNFLAYKVLEYYQTEVCKIIDIGPSTENSMPNYGLCDFKEGIGCNISSKLSFSFIFD